MHLRAFFSPANLMRRRPPISWIEFPKSVQGKAKQLIMKCIWLRPASSSGSLRPVHFQLPNQIREKPSKAWKKTKKCSLPFTTSQPNIDSIYGHRWGVKPGTTTGYESGEIAGMPNIYSRLHAIIDYVTEVLLILLPLSIPYPDQSDGDDWALAGPITCRTR
jgi:hypothetical protein